MWISDDEGVIGLPRVGHRGGGGVVGQARPPGEPRVPRRAGRRSSAERATGRSPVDDDGVCRTFAAGGLEFRHVEPFKTLTMTYDGTALDTTAGRDGAWRARRRPRIRLQVESR